MRNQTEKLTFELALEVSEYLSPDELLNQCIALSKAPAASKDAFIASADSKVKCNTCKSVG
jgi:hypothetical protein